MASTHVQFWRSGLPMTPPRGPSSFFREWSRWAGPCRRTSAGLKRINGFPDRTARSVFQLPQNLRDRDANYYRLRWIACGVRGLDGDGVDPAVAPARSDGPQLNRMVS